MNAAIRAVVRACVYHKKEIYGIYRGYEGMIDNDIKRFGQANATTFLFLKGICPVARAWFFSHEHGILEEIHLSIYVKRMTD